MWITIRPTARPPAASRSERWPRSPAENSLFHIHRELIATYPALAARVVPVIADITDPVRLALFRDHHPEVVFHAAAHKHVTLEWDTCEAVKNNVFGTRLLADVSERPRRPAVRDDLHRQGGQSHLGDGLLQADRRDVRPGPLPPQRDAVRHRAVRQRPRLRRQRDPHLPGADRQGRAGHRHAPGDEAVLHDHPRGPARAAGGNHGQGRGDLHPRHGRAGEDRRPRPRPDPDDEIEIQFTGIRPGEKLFEELSVEAESAEKTRHPKIFIGRVRPFELEDVVSRLVDLRTLADSGTPEQIRARFRELVPEYTPVVPGEAAASVQPAAPAVDPAALRPAAVGSR